MSAPFHAEAGAISALALLMMNPAAPAEQLANRYLPLDELIVTRFVSAPFPHPARADGHTYRGERFSRRETSSRQYDRAGGELSD